MNTTMPYVLGLDIIILGSFLYACWKSQGTEPILSRIHQVLQLQSLSSMNEYFWAAGLLISEKQSSHFHNSFHTASRQTLFLYDWSKVPW